jgi:hypothetical protein
MRTKSLVAGFVAAFVVQAVGWPIASRLGWKASLAQQSCDAQIQQKTDAVTKGPHASGDSIADGVLGRMAALDSPQCQAASAAYRATDNAIYWVSHIGMLVVLLSAMPWLYFTVRWIAKYRRAIFGKPPI